MMYLYVIPIVVIVALHIIFYHPKGKFAKSEHYNMRSYVENVAVTIMLTFIPFINIFIMFLAIGAVLRFIGISVNFEEWCKDFEEKVEIWLDKKL